MMASRTSTEAKLDALNKEIRGLLRRSTMSKADKKRYDEITKTLLPNVRRALAQQRERGRY